MSVRKVVTLMPTWFRIACRMVIAATKPTICQSVPVKPKFGPKVPAKKYAVPMLIAPRTVIRPRRFSQAVSQPQNRDPRIEAQW